MRNQSSLDRRAFVALCSMAGITHPAFAEALWRKHDSRSLPAAGVGSAQQAASITKDHVIGAERVIGLEFTEAERDMLVEDLNAALSGLTAVRGVVLGNDVIPALWFNVETPGLKAVPKKSLGIRVTDERRRRRDVARPADPSDLAFLSLADLSELVRTKKVTSVELTHLYLERLKRYDPTLLCVVSLTEQRALEQAQRADREISSGKYRGPLHGIPWGAKDLFAVPGYPTTWGSPIFRQQVIDRAATVVDRLDEAGAVLVAKLTLGELALGDVWFGGVTKNPWKVDQGSSGSSAGSASATAAGLVGFSLGTETLGSIVSPSTRCGVTGLRPTFGRVSRFGAMSLCPSMDKVGPICRTVEDCGLVFDAIQGADGIDPTAVDRPFRWSSKPKLEGIRIGYLKSAFEADSPTKALDQAGLEAVRALGHELVPVSLDFDIPVAGLRLILSAEAAALFDQVTRSNQDDMMVRQGKGFWPGSFRAGHFIPAVDYLNANRIRTVLMRRMDTVMEQVDVFVTPSFGGNVLLITNLTGHPALSVPSGFRADGTPVSISFIGRLFGEAELLAVGQAYQEATGFHKKHPTLAT